MLYFDVCKMICSRKDTFFKYLGFEVIDEYNNWVKDTYKAAKVYIDKYKPFIAMKNQKERYREKYLDTLDKKIAVEREIRQLDKSLSSLRDEVNRLIKTKNSISNYNQQNKEKGGH